MNKSYMSSPLLPLALQLDKNCNCLKKKKKVKWKCFDVHFNFWICAARLSLASVGLKILHKYRDLHIQEEISVDPAKRAHTKNIN